MGGTDSPGKAGLDGGGLLGDIVAVEAQAGLEAQAVARGQTDGHHLARVLQQRSPQRHRIRRGHRNLIHNATTADQ